MFSSIRFTFFLLVASIVFSYATAVSAQQSEIAPSTLRAVDLQTAPVDDRPSSPEGDVFDRLLDLDPGQLIQEQAAVAFLATPVLTETRKGGVPAAITHINQKMIRSSGSRDLNELLEIYVPNLQIARHNVMDRTIGMRGIINDRNNTFFLRVNGRIMNQRGQQGAQSERDLPTLRDIDYIDVIRGPGGAIYGPGAISGVINIVTLNGLTFEGIDAEYRQGTGFQYSSVDVRYGKKLDDDSGVFLYYGFADVQGSTQGDSPLIFGRTFVTSGTTPGYPIVAGQPVTFDVRNDRRGFLAHGKHKLHAQFTQGDFDAWVRYTRGGSQNMPARPGLQFPVGLPIDNVVGVEVGYQQLTLHLGQEFEISPCLSIDTSVSWDSTDHARLPPLISGLANNSQSYREDEILFRALANWKGNDIHSFAFGVEYSNERFGMQSGLLSTPPTSDRQRPITSPWTTDTYSMLAEYQVQLTDDLTGYLTGRMDHHSYTAWLYSPRAALVHTPNDWITNKIIASQSTRRPDDDDMRASVLRASPAGTPETVQVLEVRHERQSTEELSWALSAFWNDWDVLSWTGTTGETENLARLQIYGLELEAKYESDLTQWYFSHGFSKLANANLSNPPRTQGLTAAPLGFGNDLNNWSNHLTKFAVNHDVNPCWSVDSSLRIYWGFPGAEDASIYNGTLGGSPEGLFGWIDPGYKKAFRGNYYLNFGIENHTWDHLQIRADLYNVLGWFDRDLNKRNDWGRMSDYRVEAPAVGVSVRYIY